MDASELHRALRTLGELLAHRGHAYDVIAIGGGGLLLTGHIERPTVDIDIVALRDEDVFRTATELPPALVTAVGDVASLLGLAPTWLNAKPADVFRLGLPDGYEKRLITRRFDGLTLELVGRFEQICLKLHAWVDRYPGGEKHLADLRRLEPTHAELISAARWAATHDTSSVFRDGLVALLKKLGVSVGDAL